MLWPSLSPNGGGRPAGELARMIDRDFGSYTRLRDSMIGAALASQGSGWALLSSYGGRLIVEVAHNHGNRAQLSRAILPLDVWEHAYYLDRGPDRRAWCEVFFDRLVDWRAVGARVSMRRR
jgi:Fe-Mn family superoxide dismutase